MHGTDLQTPPAAAPPVHPKRRWWWLLFVAAALLVGAGVAVHWWLTRPPAPVSVGDVVDRYRSGSPAPTSPFGGPPLGVYVYATQGSESISFGNVTHHYPDQTTLTVTPNRCGVDVRWDALAGRWSQWRLCKTDAGWRLTHYVDVHKFLYMKDVHPYACAGFPRIVCRADNGVLTQTVSVVGSERRIVDGQRVVTTHLRIDQAATGTSVSTGVVDLWVLRDGLPAALKIRDHGSSVALGKHVDYDEAASFVLTSRTPRR